MNKRRLRVPHAEFAPTAISQELHDRIQGFRMGQTFVAQLSPNSLQGNMAQRDPRLIEDHSAKLQKILVVPEIAVAPPRFFFEQPFDLLY